MIKFLGLLLVSSLIFQDVAGHGMMLEPPNRSSVWRFDSSAPPNYSDNQVFCGGEPVQNDENGGRCGVCGDNWADPHPQENENTGTYGQGQVVRTYTQGQVVDINVLLTKNHYGSFNYSLCVLPDYNAPEPEECFFDLSFEDGSFNYPIDAELSEVANRVKLPEGLTCERCVLRWTYRAGNNWGDCGDGTEALGCGPQEHFRNCADIAIL